MNKQTTEVQTYICLQRVQRTFHVHFQWNCRFQNNNIICIENLYKYIIDKLKN